MKVSKSVLSAIGILSMLVIGSIPGWSDKIPPKHPSDYGVPGGQTEATEPTFNPIVQDGVTTSLNSVFCTVDGCDATDPASSLTYFFGITMNPGSQLNSITFAPGFDTTNPIAFDVVVFDPVNFDSLCVQNNAYACSVPFSTSGINLSGLDITTTCSTTTLECTVNFLGFNPEALALGNGTVILAATTPGGPASTPFIVSENTGAVVAVPEPASVWLALLSGLVCVGLVGHRYRAPQRVSVVPVSA